MENLEQKIVDILQAKHIKGKRIALYGCSNETSILLDAIKTADLEVENKDLTAIIWSLHADEMIASVREYLLPKEQIIHIDIRRDSVLYLEYQIDRINKALKEFETVRKHTEHYCLLAPVASGDIYIALAFLEEWKRKNRVADITLIGSGRNIKDIADLYEVKSVEIINDKTRKDLVFLSSVLGGQIWLKMLSPWELNIRNTFFPSGRSRNTFVEKYQYEVFELERNSRPVYPSMSGKYNGQTRKAVIAPYAYSSPAPQLSKEIWSDIAAVIASRGYRVFTVGYGDKEPAIAGTTLIQFTYKEIPDIFGENDLFIAERNGLCDIMHNSPCNKLILFSNAKNNYAMDLYGLRNNYPDFIGEELLVSRDNDEKIVETVIQKLSI